MSAPQVIASQTARGLAQKDKWPTPVLAAVLEAIGTADPPGIDAFASEAAWWGAISENVAGVSATLPASEQALLRPLQDVAIQGAGGYRGTVGEVAAEQAEVATETAVETAKAAAGYVGPALSLGRIFAGLALLAAGYFYTTSGGRR